MNDIFKACFSIIIVETHSVPKMIQKGIIVENPLCVCGALEDTNHFLFNCGRFQKLFKNYSYLPAYP